MVLIPPGRFQWSHNREDKITDCTIAQNALHSTERASMGVGTSGAARANIGPIEIDTECTVGCITPDPTCVLAKEPCWPWTDTVFVQLRGAEHTSNNSPPIQARTGKKGLALLIWIGGGSTWSPPTIRVWQEGALILEALVRGRGVGSMSLRVKGTG